VSKYICSVLLYRQCIDRTHSFIVPSRVNTVESRSELGALDVELKRDVQVKIIFCITPCKIFWMRLYQLDVQRSGTYNSETNDWQMRLHCNCGGPKQLPCPCSMCAKDWKHRRLNCSTIFHNRITTAETRRFCRCVVQIPAAIRCCLLKFLGLLKFEW